MTKLALSAVSVLALATACRDETPGGLDSGPGSPALPDAHVVARFDAGPQAPELPRPTLNNVSPPSGPESGGTRVTLRGTNFLEVDSATASVQVFFGATAAAHVVVLDELS